MKKLLLSCIGLLTVAATVSAGSIKLTTSAPVGTKLQILANAASATEPLGFDFGNGVIVYETIDPKQPAYNRWIKDYVVEGPVITITGNVTEFQLNEADITSVEVDGMYSLTKLDFGNNKIEDFKILNPTPLTNIDLKDNKLKNDPTGKYSFEMAGLNLKWLTLTDNPEIETLDVTANAELEYLTLTRCSALKDLRVAPVGGAHSAITSISAQQCSLEDFGPYIMPKLMTLELEANNLCVNSTDGVASFGEMPKLSMLSVSNNKYIKEVDLTKFPKLGRVYLSDCDLSSVDLSACTELTSLNVSGNTRLAHLDLSKVVKTLSNLSLARTGVRKLDLEPLTSLTYLDISDTDIDRLDFRTNYFVQSVTATNTKLQWVDFGGLQAGRVQKIDLRNNPCFTQESMAFTVFTMPQARKSYSTNLYLEGSNPDKADTSFSWSDGDMQWIPDVHGDGSATYPQQDVVLDGATFTGETRSGNFGRLYPLMGYELKYENLKVFETEGGKFIITQVQSPWFQEIDNADEKARLGVPIHIQAYPNPGLEYKGVTLNGVEINDPWFILTEEGTANIKVNFGVAGDIVSFTSDATGEISLSAITTEGDVTVDFGNGTAVSAASGASITGTPAGAITISGKLSSLNLAGTGLTSIDLSKSTELTHLNIADNGLTADQLNDLYYGLNNHPYHSVKGLQAPAVYLTVATADDTNANDHAGADSSIAAARGWTTSHAGDNSGSNYAYLDILPAEVGTVTASVNGEVLPANGKIAKGATITLNAELPAGYVLAGYSLNGQEFETSEATLVMPDTYTVLAPIVKVGTGVTLTPAVDSAAAQLYTIDGRKVIGTPAAGLYIRKDGVKVVIR